MLEQALDPQHPLLERVKFLAIVATNLEEFFMVRVAALLCRTRLGLDDVGVDGLRATETLARIRAEACQMLRRQVECWREGLEPSLRRHRIHILEPAGYTPAISEFLEAYFTREVAPVLQPVEFGPSHGLPFSANVTQNVAVALKEKGRTRLARIMIPAALPRFVPLPAALAPPRALAFVYLEDVIRANMATLFPDAEIEGTHLFRLLRDADMVIQEDEAHDLLASVHRGLRRRRRGPVAMLQIETTTPPGVVDRLMRRFSLDEHRVYRVEDRIGFGDWMQLAAVPRQDLRYASVATGSIWSTDPETTVFDELRHHDRLVHHPYESFNTVEAFIQTAVTDPSVAAIKIALYRIGTNSLLVGLLVEAAKAGKHVTVLVELKARFDEENNINWATELEAAGAQVAYGSLKLKTHAKVCLVLRNEASGGLGYVHIGTGNYNAQTARLYTDLGLFTSRASIVQDAADLFTVLAGKSRHPAYRELLVAPTGLRRSLIALIDHEASEARAGRPAGIIIKVNSLTDPEVIRAMYQASQAGVKIDLIVRGVCSLRPGVAGVSESISVRSIVGRFLEHSRIFWFQNGQAPRVFIGSADIMERSFDRRVEVLCPVHDRRLVTHLRDVVLDTLLRGTRRTSILQSDGQYRPAQDDGARVPSIDAQEALMPRYAALHRSRRSRRTATPPPASRGTGRRAAAPGRPIRRR